MQQKVIAIDPGISGAFVITDGQKYIQCYPMPVTPGKLERRIPFGEVYGLLGSIKREHGKAHVFLERAVSFGMGTKAAFNYGRGFEAVTIAIVSHDLPFTLVEPGKWSKEMHEGISASLKPKAKSLIAVERLYPQLVRQLPKRPRGGIHDGFVDALLIAGYGLRKLGVSLPIGEAKGTPPSAVKSNKAPRHKPLIPKGKPVTPKNTKKDVDDERVKTGFEGEDFY